MPEKPIPEQDPITGKSYAIHYLIATVILIGTLFWALYDEAWGQRPWKAFQDEWKNRYSAFLNTARSKSATSEKDVEQNPEYAALKQAYEKTYEDSKAQAAEARKAVDDASARLLAVQSVFTDRRAYVNAISYEIETSTSASSKASKQKELAEYKSEKATVEFPDGSKKDFNFEELEKTYNEIRDERTKLSLQLGDVLKPVTAAKAKMDLYISDHMVDLTPQQIDGLKKKAAEWDPTIVQINVADANIVDRCKGREEAGRICRRARKPFATRVIADSRSRQVRLLALSSGKRTRDHQHRKSPRQLRALALATVSERKCASGLSKLPRRRHGPGERRCAVANH
ncbi:MAG: hypothetical protein ABSG72_14525 [Candidatus Sulfotelmatobacter sp.]